VFIIVAMLICIWVGVKYTEHRDAPKVAPYAYSEGDRVLINGKAAVIVAQGTDYAKDHPWETTPYYIFVWEADKNEKRFSYFEGHDVFAPETAIKRPN